MDIYKSDKIFTKKFQFSKFFTKAVKKVLVENFGDKALFKFDVVQNVLIQSHTSRKSENGVSGVRPFPFKLDVSKTTGQIHIASKGIETTLGVLPNQWEELSEETIGAIVKYVYSLIGHLKSLAPENQVEIDVTVLVNIDENNYKSMNDPESLKLVRELEGKPSKQSKSQSKNELQEIADKISKEGVDPEIVSKIVEIVLATLPIVMKK